MSEWDYEYNKEQEEYLNSLPISRDEWFQDIEANKQILVSIIDTYHPSRKKKSDLKITAQAAEKACEKIRTLIKQNTKEDVVILFENALKEKDQKVMLKILNDVWFGVPESTSCWKIPGFKELVDFIENSP